ncbi:hypothetical protein NE865_09096 [Phthorimaea operculella]|nr:hypothetical protein NE865_09096 [Phthorimaea operculella]
MSSNLILFVVILPTCFTADVKQKTYILTESDFSTIDGHYTDAIPTDESKYPWIGKLIHSRYGDYPMLCTVSCIHDQIFLTSARCLIIHSFKISITRIKYQKQFFDAKAFLRPPELIHSKHYFDDIGLIVTEQGPPGFKWVKVALPSGALATRKNAPAHNLYQWFEELNFVGANATHTVIGYGYGSKEDAMFRHESMEYKLVALNVSVGITICEKYFNAKDGNYHVPCYHYCNLTEIRKGSTENCKVKSIEIEGAPVYNFRKKELLGVATWSVNSFKDDAPVGFAVPNTGEFFKNFNCAKIIAADILPHPGKGYYNWLCHIQAKPKD